jgi:hypothetical protein
MPAKQTMDGALHLEIQEQVHSCFKQELNEI